MAQSCGPPPSPTSTPPRTHADLEGAPGPGIRNPGVPFDAHWIRRVHVNRNAVERRATLLQGRRNLEKEWKAAWLLRAISLMDLTTLSGDDTPGTVKRLCAKARRPLRSDIEARLGVGALNIRPAAVCVYHEFVESACDTLKGTGISVAAVSTGFPHGLSPMETRRQEIRASVAVGAGEIDAVITRAHVLTGNWEALYNEVRTFRDDCGEAHLKTILATGELGSLVDVARASRVCMMAGADFIKTSTGQERVNATLPAGLVMAREIRAFRERTGYAVGFKPAGGIRAAKDALLWMILMKEELGDAWLDARLFRFGASSLLADIVQQLEHHTTTRYPALPHQPLD